MEQDGWKCNLGDGETKEEGERSPMKEPSIKPRIKSSQGVHFPNLRANRGP